MSKRKTAQYDDDEFDSVVPSADSFRRPLQQGETVPPIPSIYEQLAVAALTPWRPTKSSSR